MTALRLTVLILAAARLARLTTRDKITRGLREWWTTRLLYTPEQRRAQAAGDPLPAPRSQWQARARVWLHDLTSCDWCTTVWWAAALAVADFHCHHPGRRRRRAAYQLLVVTLGASYAAGWLTQHEQPTHLTAPPLPKEPPQ